MCFRNIKVFSSPNSVLLNSKKNIPNFTAKKSYPILVHSNLRKNQSQSLVLLLLLTRGHCFSLLKLNEGVFSIFIGF